MVFSRIHLGEEKMEFNKVLFLIGSFLIINYFSLFSMEESIVVKDDKVRKGGVGLEGIGIFNLAGDGKTFVYCNADKRCIEVRESDKLNT